MENNVVTLKTAKKLKSAGFPQNTVYYWAQSNYQLLLTKAGKSYQEHHAAPTAQEIADQLPFIRQEQYCLTTGRINADGKPNPWGAWYGLEGTPEQKYKSVVPTICEALASLWLKLKSQPPEGGGE